MDVWTHDLLGLAYGLIVGISLGVTGGGGSIFAVPLLIYGLGLPVGTSIGLSLASVGITAGFGAALRLKAKEVDLRAGLVFAAAGMALAPAGAWLGTRVSAALLLSTFAVLMAFVGIRMWRGKAGAGVVPGPCVERPGGGFAGMFAGSALSTRLPAPVLQKVFAAGMWLVAACMLARNLPAFFQS